MTKIDNHLIKQRETLCTASNQINFFSLKTVIKELKFLRLFGRKLYIIFEDLKKGKKNVNHCLDAGLPCFLPPPALLSIG